MIISSIASHAQEENKYSIWIDANYLFHYIERDTRNNFNYGFSLLMTEKIAKIKVGIGINYSTLNYNYTVKPMDYEAFYLKKREYKVQYLNFPLLVFFNINSGKLMNVDPYVGIIANKVINNEVVKYYIDTPPFREEDIARTRNLGFTFRVGVNVSKTISEHIILNVAPFADFKFVTNGLHTAYYELPDSRVSIGFKIGFEYLLD